MERYSQWNEQAAILACFDGVNDGNFLDIGAY